MASRRTRIKGIANIPQRRKNNLTNEQDTELQVKSEEKSATERDNLTSDIEKNPDSEEPHLQSHPDVLDKSDKLTPVSQSNVNFKSYNGGISQPISRCDTDSDKITTNDEINKIDNENAIIPQHNKNSNHVSERKISNSPQTDDSRPIIWRKFIKPTISANIINKKPKQSVDRGCRKKPEPPITEKTSEKTEQIQKGNKIDNVDLEELVASPKPGLVHNQDVRSDNVKLKQPRPVNVSNLNNENEMTLDEIHLTSQNGAISKPQVPLDKGVKKINHCASTAQNSDNEYPPPPPSPSKINRSRIKAIPRLSYRKTSFSASESEDESRKNYNRHRNDSVCSTTSGVADSIAECMSPQRPKEYNSIIQKKCNRTDQSRKLAEARREFQRRFGTTKPDRQRLTMIDLIFYNPTTNPMTEKMKSKENNEEGIQENDDVQIDNESERIDDPETINEDAGKSDEENEMPVPQIKIGPSGEIILDEKSLVIESKEVKKQREELQKTKLIDADLNTSYGIYKRQKRAKKWTQSETLRFYKALNTIGTDFALMCEVFPKRTRRELKMKFKKEERINKTLIYRAIMQPCSFDFTELKHEVDMEERELEEVAKQKEDGSKLKKQKNEEKIARKRKVSMAENTEETKEPETSLQPRPQKIHKAKKPKIKKLTIESVLENSDADESDISTQSESEDEISMPLRPTRSGRVPKVTKKFDNTQPVKINGDSVMKNKATEDIKTNDIEPGSIMIMTEKGPEGEPVYKIYMVTADQNAAPLNLTSDVVSRAIEFKKGLTAQNIMTISTSVTDDEADNTAVAEENNVTIPADEGVTTLKGVKQLVSETDVSKKGNVSSVENNVTIPANEPDTSPEEEILSKEHG